MLGLMYRETSGIVLSLLCDLGERECVRGLKPGINSAILPRWHMAEVDQLMTTRSSGA
jgi:hypothetical protein